MEPGSAKHRQYEAFRAFFVEDRQSSEVARAFGYTPASFQVMCHHFRRDPRPEFFVSPKSGPRSQPKQSAAREAIVELRKRNHSVYEISEALKARDLDLSPTAVREVSRRKGSVRYRAASTRSGPSGAALPSSPPPMRDSSP
jgi:hypothetical protein